MENLAAIKSRSSSLTHGFISFMENLKKFTEEMKENSFEVGEMLLMIQREKLQFKSACNESSINHLKHDVLQIPVADVLPLAAADIAECGAEDDRDATTAEFEAETESRNEAETLSLYNKKPSTFRAPIDLHGVT